MGFCVYVVMVALGEMGAWLPHKKSFAGYATRFVDPALGYVARAPISKNREPGLIHEQQFCYRLELFLQICYCAAEQSHGYWCPHPVLAPQH